jgi:hypothetical protein
MILVDKEGANRDYVKIEEDSKKEYASKGVAGTALGLGIAGTALWLLGGNGRGLFGNCGCNNAAEVGLATNEQYLERKECEDAIALTNAIWQQSYNNQQNRFNDRQVINEEMFGIYKSTRDGFDIINAKHNQDAFNLYKYSRDSKDELAGEIGALRTEVAVLKATRPYQDALIQCDIRRVAEHADFNLWRRTCRMITGELVLPNSPTVTGYPSYNPCNVATTVTPSAE